MGAGTADQASAWAEALERPTPGARKEGRTNWQWPAPALSVSSLASCCWLVSTCQRARRPPARPTLGGSPTWAGVGHMAHSECSPCHPALAALPCSVSMQYLLSMVVEYFGRVGLPGHLYNRIHFFLAL